MMREQDRLRVLQVRHAGQDHRAIIVRHAHQHLPKLEVGLHELLGKSLGGEARVGGHLVIARATRV